MLHQQNLLTVFKKCFYTLPEKHCSIYEEVDGAEGNAA